MQLSKRMKSIASMVSSGNRLADVGCDHGYLPVSLCLEGRIPGALAMDVNPGPLKRAEEHIAQYGLERYIKTRLSDGLAGLAPGEVDTVVIAGMGGRLIARILEEGRQVCESLRELVLGPQSEVYGVRTWLEMNDFRIDREDMVLEDGKYYPVIHAVPAEGGKPCRNMAEPGGKILTEEERLFGPCLLKERHPVLQRYLLREEALRKSLTERLKEADGARAGERRNTIEEEMRHIRAALSYYEM